MTQKLSILTGCSAGGTESFVVVPFELVKIKYASSLVTQNFLADSLFVRLQDKKSTFAGPLDVLRHIVRNEGLFGLYAGMEATFWRYCNSPPCDDRVC